jgi:hypothetical protein
MGIESLKDSQIADNIRRYREAEVATGGHFTLADLLLEQRRRTPAPFPAGEVAKRILEIAALSRDRRASYLDLWTSFSTGEALDRACIAEGRR